MGISPGYYQDQESRVQLSSLATRAAVAVCDDDTMSVVNALPSSSRRRRRACGLAEPTEQWIYDDVLNVGSELNKRINIVSGLWKPAKLALLGDGNMDWNGSQAAAASSSSS